MIDVEQPYCADVDECNDERANFNKLDVRIFFIVGCTECTTIYIIIYMHEIFKYSSPDILQVCGDHTNCINSVGSFSCECQAGFHSWEANRGCLDIDESDFLLPLPLFCKSA